MKKAHVALTGGIGAGKSTAAKIFESLGAFVVSGDELGRQVLTEDVTIASALIARFGLQIRNEDGSLNRKKIASLVFGDAAQSAWLTQLTFPGIYSRWKMRAEEATKPVVILDAALIFEWKIESEFDLVVTVQASNHNAILRSAGRFSEIDLLKRQEAQLSTEEKSARSHITIDNDGSLDRLEKQVKTVWTSKILPLIA